VFTPAGENGRPQNLKNSSESRFDSWIDSTIDPLLLASDTLWAGAPIGGQVALKTH
jgi:hypothetical protein